MKKLLRKKLALMLANLKKKRPYYVECEYLESTGTQYIDLGITSKSSMRAKAKFNLANVSAQAIFGSATVSATGVGVFFGTASTGVVYCNKTDTPISPSLTLVTNTNYEFDMSLTTVSINGVNYTAATTTDNNYNMLLFARILAGNVDRNISGKIYYFKLWDNGVLVRDFIPVLDWDMTPCMYDRVTEQLFYNAGTGNFIAGREIHPVEYIETEGTSYINTGYIPSGSTETEITTMLKDQMYSRFMFGCRSAQSNNTYACLAHSSNRIGYRVGSGGYVYSNGYDEVNTKHTYKIANGVFYRDDVVVDTTCQGATTSPNSPLSLLTINTNNVLDTTQPFIGNLYSCTIKDNNVLVRDYIPAIDQNGVGYMFDRVSHTIYDNAGTGNFAYPPVPIEWVQTDGINSYINTNEMPPSAGILRLLETKVATLNVFQNSPIFGNAQSEGQVCWGLEYYNSSYSYAYAATKKSYPIHLTSIITASSSPVKRSFLVASTQIAYIDDVAYDVSAEEYQGTQNNTTICLGRLGPNIIPSAEARNRFYSARILNLFVPVFKDGKAGMLNIGTNEFCGNAGTGTIVGGPIIESG